MKKGIEHIQNVQLSSQEKEGIFARIDTHMKANPLKDLPRPVGVFNNFFVQLRSYKYAYSLIIILGVMFAGVGVIDASEKALPGDLFYLIKINVTEKVKSAIAFTSEAKARFEEEKIINRLDEARALAQKGELKNGKRDRLEKEVEKTAKVIVATRQKKRKNVSSPVHEIMKINKTNIDENAEFKNKINTRFEEIKKVDTNADKEQVNKFEEKVKEQLLKKLEGNNVDIENKDIRKEFRRIRTL